MADARRRWTLVIFLYVLLSGATLQARGALVPEFAAAFDVSEGLLGLVAPASTVGFVSALVVVGFAVGRLPVRRVYVVGAAGSVGAVLLIAAAPVYWLLLGAILVRGAMTGAFRAVDRPVLSHLYPGSRGRVLSLQSMVWAVGAAGGPLFVTGVLLVGDWRLVYLLLAAAWLPGLALLYRTGPPPGIERETSLSPRALLDILRKPAVAGMCFAQVFLGGIEANFFTWLPFYASQFLPRAEANLLLSVYLVAYVPGRYAASRLVDRYRTVDLLLVDAALILGAVFLTFTFARGTGLFVGVFAVGFLVSGAFPVLIAWALNAVPEYSGPINAVGMIAGQTGFLVFPAAVGGLAEWTGIVTAIHAITAISAAYVLASAVNWIVGADG